MKRFVSLLLMLSLLMLPLMLLLMLTGCTKTVYVEYPQANIPLAARQENWTASNGAGSCVWATAVSLLEWGGNHRAANRIRTYGGGASLDSLTQVLDAEQIAYATTSSGDEDFLRSACDTRRGAGVVVEGGKHCICVVGRTNDYYLTLDNNDIEKFEWIPRAAFLRDWREAGGWAFAFTNSPVPPIATNHR